MKLFLLLLVSAVATVSVQSQCLEDGFMTNFEPGKYLGDWYELYGTGQSYEDDNMQCIMAHYTAPPAGSNYSIDVLNMGVRNNKTITFKAKATKVNNTNAEAKYTVVFEGTGDPRPANYWVMDTDYTGYAIVYSCYMSNATRNEFLWVLSRTTYIEVDKLEEVYAKVNETVPWDRLRPISFTPDACDSAATASITFFMIALSTLISKLI